MKPLVVGTNAMFARASIVGSSRSSGLGSFDRNQFTISSTAAFFIPCGILPDGKDMPLRLESASKVGSSMSSGSTSFCRSQLIACSTISLFSRGLKPVATGKVPTFLKARRVGSSSSSKSALLSRNQLITANSASFLCARLIVGIGGGMPAMLQRMGKAPSSTSPGLTLLFRTQLVAPSRISLFLFEEITGGLPEKFAKASSVGSSRS